MKKLYVLLTALLITNALYAQLDPLYSQYFTNPMIFNPAYAGMNNAWNTNISYRNQWTGFEGSPSTVNFNSHISLVDNRVGIGVMAIRDTPGALKNTEFEALGSYRLKLKDYTLSFGMQFGFMTSKFDYTRVNLANPTDAAFEGNGVVYNWPNVGVGALLQSDNFLVGLSIPRMLKVTEPGAVQSSTLASQHFYLYGTYVYYVGTRFRLKPAVLVRGAAGAPVSADLNFSINIDQKYTGGVFVRNFRSYGALVQAFLFEKFRFGYAIEIPTNQTTGAVFTTHELTLGVKLTVLNSHDRTFSEF